MLSLIVFYKEFSSYIQGWLLQYVSVIWYGELNIVGELAVSKEYGMFKGREIGSKFRDLVLKKSQFSPDSWLFQNSYLDSFVKLRKTSI